MAIRNCCRDFDGWMLHEREDPTAVPVLRRGLWVLLANDGTYELTDKTTAEEA